MNLQHFAKLAGAISFVAATSSDVSAHIKQTGNHSDYHGTLSLNQGVDGTVSGIARFPEQLLAGSVSGTVAGKNVVLDVSWENGPIGHYSTTLSDDGIIMNTGITTSPGYTPESWDAQRSNCQ